MRILHVYPKDDYFTGAAIQLWELANALARRGHDIVIATRPADHWAQRCRRTGLVQYGVPMRSELDLPSAWRLAQIIRAHRIDVVHAHKGKARTLAMIAAAAVRRPVLILNRSVSFPLGRFQRLGYTSRRVNAIVAVCESIRQVLVRSGVDAKKIEVIYSATDTARFHPGIDGSAVRLELGLQPGDFVITQIGVRSWKGNDDVLLALLARPQGRADGSALPPAVGRDLGRRNVSEPVAELPPRPERVLLDQLVGRDVEREDPLDSWAGRRVLCGQPLRRPGE